jgi:hypothetical protein
MADDAVTLGILGIVFTIVIGFLVYFLQKRTDSKMESIIKSINELTRQQFEVINEEKERHKAMRDYFIHHTQSNLGLIKHAYDTLRNFVNGFKSDGSEERKRVIIDICERNSQQIQSYIIPFTRDQLEIASRYLKSPWLANKFIDEVARLGSVFMTIRQNPNLLENHAGLESIRESIEYQIESINNLITKLNEEHSE